MPTSNEIIKAQSAMFDRQMKSVLDNLRQFVNYNATFTMESGFILPSQENYETIILVVDQLLDQLKEDGYYDLVQKFTTNNKEFTDVQIKDMAKRFGAATTYYGAVEKTTLKGLKEMQYNGMVQLGQSRVNAIGQALYNNVIAGSTEKQLLVELDRNLGNMSKYAETYIRTAKREYSQQTEYSIADEAGIAKDEIIWEYIGAPLQDNSHPECVWALIEKEHAPFFTNDERIEFESGGGYEHSEPRWNCQHIFGITDMTYEEYLEV